MAKTKAVLKPEEYRQKWGIPDWRDEKAYPKTLSEELWKWEFLRRRDDYRQDWEREYLKTVEWYSQHTYEEWLRPNQNDDLTAPGPIEPGNFDCDPASPGFVVHMKHEVRKYRMPQLINPALERPSGIYTLFSVPALIEGGGAVWLPPGLVLQLDPMTNLEEHIKVLKMGLQQLQKGRAETRRQRGKWPKYLRAFDARTEGTTFETIGEVLRSDLVYSEAAARAKEYFMAAKGIIKGLTA
jgi:hypothetical protein